MRTPLIDIRAGVRCVELADPAHVEDRGRGDRVAVARADARVSRADPDDAGAVGDDLRVVAPDPEAARRVTLAVRQLREEDGAAAVEPGLEPGRVVPSRGRLAAGERGEHQERDEGSPHAPILAPRRGSVTITAAR
jgi:hypothetical protein